MSRSGLAPGQPITLVRDLRTTPNPLYVQPTNMVAAGGRVYFVTAAAGSGSELWTSDGTPAGTFLVKDIRPGAEGSNPGSLAAVGESVFFQADDGVNGAELWTSDGTEAGTVMVKDVTPGPLGSSPGWVTAAGSVVYFSASGPVSASLNANELWRSDGTEAGTYLVKDIGPDYFSSNPRLLLWAGGTLYFVAATPELGQELWKSDGTAGGTLLVKDIRPGTLGSNLENLTVSGALVYFSANDGVNGQELWKTDGTETGTAMVEEIWAGGSGSSAPTNLRDVGGLLYFSADDGVVGRELWRSDGTADGTVLVEDIQVGGGSSPANLVAMGGTLYFTANDGTWGRELWRSDGTGAGTERVTDICTGSMDSIIGPLTVFAGKLYFQEGGCTPDGVELWASDGTPTGTAMVKNICSGTCSSWPGSMTATATSLFFGANDARGRQLWKSDGTEPGTVTVSQIDVLSSFPGNLVDLSGTLLFVASDPVDTTRKLWKTDGTAPGTVQVAAGNFYYPSGLTVLGGKVLFSADSGGGDYELWSTDGTDAGTTLVKDVNPGGVGSNPSLLTAAGGRVYFAANDGTHGPELWTSDGTADGTLLVEDIWPGGGGSSIQRVTAIGSRVFFVANDSLTGQELWVSDGTPEGTNIVKDIHPGGNGSSPNYLIDVAGTLYFTANDGTGTWIFRSNGTAAGTTAVSTTVGNASNLTNLNGTVFFTTNWGNDVELWKTDGTSAGTVQVADINPTGSSVPTNLTAVGAFLYFRANDGTSGAELWRSDGTAAGTWRIADVAPGPASSLPRTIANVGGWVYFVANDGVHGEEVWKTDGTPVGTFLVQDLNPGAAHSNAGPFLMTASRLYLCGDDGTTGSELQKIEAADISVVKIPSATEALQGSTLTWSISVSNAGPAAATGVRLIDPFPAGLTYTSSSPPDKPCSLAGGTLTCYVGTVTAGAFATVLVNTTVNVGYSGTITNTVRAATLEADPIGGQDTASASVTVPGPQPATNLQATATSSSSIALDWTSSLSPHTGTRVERSTDGTAWTVAGSVGAGIATFVDEPLSAGTLFYYRVVVLQAGVGESAPSNVAVARTFPAVAAKVCATRLGPQHTWSRYPSVAWNGTDWGAAWQGRTLGRELDDVFFQLLDGPSGHAMGSPLNLSDDDMYSSYPTVRWNGSRFAVVWYTGMRGPTGSQASAVSLALLDATGNRLRGNVSLLDEVGPVVYINENLHTAVAWTGSEWGIVLPVSAEAGEQIDLYFVRVSPDGDRLGTPVRLTDTPEDEIDVSLAWNGTEYGVTWVWSGGPPSVFFQRMQANGTRIGTPTLVMGNPSGVAVTSAVWDGTGWAVAFTEAGSWPDYPTWTDLARLDADGTLNGSPVRVSTDYDPDRPPEDQMAIYDELPSVFSKPGGGYVVFGSSQANVIGTSTPPTWEITRYETDENGARLGARTTLSTVDTLHSVYACAAFDGSRYLVVYNEGSPGTQEIARVIAGASGPPLAGPALLTAGGSPGNTSSIATSSQPLTLAVGDGFAVVWGEVAADLTYQLGTKVFDGSGNMAASRWPISTRTFRARPGGVGVGNTFALAWKDNPNNVVFDRYDATGASLLGEVVVASGQGGRPGVGVAFSGEAYGVTWISGTNLAFQRVASSGALIGARTTVALGATPVNVPPQVAWTGSGWAVVYVLGTNLQFVLLDPSGAVSVPPVALTATPSTKGAVSISWSGSRLGVAWADNPNVPPYQDILFTSVGPNGARDFDPVNVASSAGNEGSPSLYWDGERFRLAHTFGVTTVLREIGIDPDDGAVTPGERLLSNRGGANSVAFNGVTTGIAWQQLNDDYFETTACLDDATPPPCPSASASVSGRTATIVWSPVADAESGLYRYYVYRDGATLAEVFPSSASVLDGGFAPGATHVYEVRSYNGAWRESTACSTLAPVADLSVTKSDGASSEIPGTPVSWTITVSNAGPSTVSSVHLADSVPVVVTGATFTPAVGAYDPGTGLWTGLSLGPGQSASMTLAGTIDPAARGMLSNTATVAVTPGVVDTNAANDAATDADTLVPSADVSVTIADSPDPVLQGAVLTYSLNVSNAGPSTATAVVLMVTLPPGVAFQSSDPPSPTCTHASGTVACNLGNLAPAASAPVTVSVKPDAGTVGTLTVTATVAAAESDPDGTDNSSSAATTVPGPAPVHDLYVTARTAMNVSLKWTDPQGSETGFRLERSTNGTSWTAINIVGPDATTYTDGSRAPATLYFYRVVALQSGVGEAPPSNVAATTTLATVAAKVCATQMGTYGGAAGGPMLAWSGSTWAAAWSDRVEGLLTEAYFRLFDAATLAPLGSPVRVSTTGAATVARALRWNGSSFGLLWQDTMKAPDGANVYEYRFTRFDAAGNRLPGDVTSFRQDGIATYGPAEVPLVWNGDGWGVFVLDDPVFPSDVRYHRLDATGRAIGSPVEVTATTDWELSVSAAWSGSEYGVAFVRSGNWAEGYQVLLQRVAADGALLGPPAVVWENTMTSEVAPFGGSTSVLWDGTAWVVAFTDIGPEPDRAESVWLRKMSSAGLPASPAVRLSPDWDPDLPGEQRAVYDRTPNVFARTGGGYVVLTTSLLRTTNRSEVCRYEADGALVRVGTRIQVSTGDNRNSSPNRGATDGSRVLAAWNESRTVSQEIAGALLDASGATLVAPVELTTGHVLAYTGAATVIPLGNGFGSLYTYGSATLPTLIGGQFWNGTGAVVATRTPLSARGIRGAPAAVATGNTFAVAWKDSSNNAVVFGRFDATGAPLIPEAEVATSADGQANVGLAFSGESYGLAYWAGWDLYLDRVSADGASLGPRSLVTTTAENGGPGPQVQWVGTGWAIVWLQETHLYYALLDGAGAVVVPPIQVTFTPRTEGGYQLLWTGTHLGLAWYEYAFPDPPGGEIFFTVLGLDGIKDFDPVVIPASDLDDSHLAPYWDVDRFRIVTAPSNPGTLREVAVLPDGTVLPGEKMLWNSGISHSVAWNGATLGISWWQGGYVHFMTTACLADATAPPCPAATTVFDGSQTTVSWSPVTDAESGIWRYDVYRDGLQVAEEPSTATSWTDTAPTPGVNHAYEVRAFNKALKDSTGCTGITPSADLSLSVTDAPDPVQPGGTITYTLTVTNGGPSSATDVTLTDVLPAGLAFVSATPGLPTCTHSAGTVSCALGALASSQGTVVALVTTLGVTTPVTNTASVDALQPDPVSANNTASASTSICPTAPVAASNAPLCAGGTLQLTASYVAGGVYAWTGPNEFTSNAQNPAIGFVTAAATGSYSVTVTVGGCTSLPGTTNVVVHALPATPSITAPARVWPEQAFTASVPSVSGVTYAWHVTNGTITGGDGTNEVSVTAGPTGPVTITLVETDTATGCASAEASVSIPVGSPATRFYPVTPCRLFDTRKGTGDEAAAPALAAGQTRTFSVGTRCGLDVSTVRSLSVNVTVADQTADGELVVWRGDLVAEPITSSISFRAGRARANNGILELSRSGDGTIQVTNRSTGTVSFILDVNGVFK